MDIASFDIDGVIFMGKYPGVRPGPADVIITGRSKEERPETVKMLTDRGIHNYVFFNTLLFTEKTRVTSGIHKGNTIKDFNETSSWKRIVIHFEDDPIQAEEIKKIVPDVQVVLLQHDLVEKENVRHSIQSR